MKIYQVVSGDENTVLATYATPEAAAAHMKALGSRGGWEMREVVVSDAFPPVLTVEDALASMLGQFRSRKGTADDTVLYASAEAALTRARERLSVGFRRVYVVQDGDTLSDIAKRFGVPDYMVIARLNRIADPGIIHPGWCLIIP